jgi:diadenosine tetraphosphate (Ap4A) HIT family hydrolase
MRSNPSARNECLSCAAAEDRLRLTPGERILRAEYWDVEHAHPTSIPGWLVIVLRRHAHAIHELEETELRELGDLIRLLSEILHSTLDCEKEYLVQFSEMPGFQHVHFHLIARAVDLLPELQSGGIFGALGDAVDDPLSEKEIIRISSQLKSLAQRN